jgi:hypothetical protein
MKLGAGGSVATSAWDLARMAGCSPLYLAGLDLGYPDGATHAKGSFFEERSHGFACRFLPVETANFAALRSAGRFRVASNRGGTVLTDKRMIAYKWWFESKMREFPGLRSYNLSAGVAVSGMGEIGIGAVLALPDRRPEIDSLMDRCLGSEGERFSGESGRNLPATLARLADSLSAMEEAARRGVGLTDAFLSGRRGKEETARIIRDLDAVDRELSRSGSKEVASFIVPPVAVMTGDAATIADALMNGRRVYAEIAEAASFHSDLLKKAQARLDSAEY